MWIKLIEFIQYQDIIRVYNYAFSNWFLNILPYFSSFFRNIYRYHCLLTEN